MTIQIAFLEKRPTHVFASILAKKDQVIRFLGTQRQEWEAPQRDCLSTFNALVLQHQDDAYNFAFYLLGDPDKAADATQQAFINAYLHFNQFQGTNFRSWLLKIVKNTCIDELRRTKRQNTFSLNAYEDNEQITSTSFVLNGQAPTPEQTIDQKETSHQIQTALNTLGEPFRTALILVDIKGMDYQEAARVIGVPVGTLKSRLARSRRRFREAFEQ